MDTNLVLVLVGVGSWFITVVRALRNPSMRDWIPISIAALAVTGAAWFVIPDQAGYVALGLWLIFLEIPNLAFSWLGRLYAREEYGKALRILYVLRWLHPGVLLREQIIQVQAIDLRRRGQSAAALEVLNHHTSTARGSQGYAILIEAYRLQGNWAGALKWIRDNLTYAQLRADPNLIVYYVRALGETGDLNGVVQAMWQYRAALRRSPYLQNLALVMAFAFWGREDMTAQCLELQRKDQPRDVPDLWLGTAELAAGHEAEGRSRLEALLASASPQAQDTIRRRLAFTARAADVLTPESVQLLAEMEKEFVGQISYLQKVRLGLRRTYATYALIALNLISFSLEIVRGGAENRWTLYGMGALYVKAFLRGEWWRLFTFLFLHYGWLHLTLNMLALYFLGQFAESLLGRFRYLLVYLVSGLGSGLIVVWLTDAGVLEPGFYVGASGCIIGLIGAELAIMLRLWLKERVKLAVENLVVLVLIILTQVAFDLIVPHVGMVAHLSGLGIGFIIALLLPYQVAGTPEKKPAMA